MAQTIVIKNFGNFLLGRTFEPRDPRYAQDLQPLSIPTQVLVKKAPVDGVDLREGAIIEVHSEDRTLNGNIPVDQVVTYVVKDFDDISFRLELQAVNVSEK